MLDLVGKERLILTKQVLLWGRLFSIPIEFDCYEGDRVTKEQINTLERLITNQNWLEKSKDYIEKYCKNDVMEDNDNHKKDNIFSYIKPEYLLVKRDKENQKIALMCKYRYDLEHGLAVVFSPNGEVTVGIQDIIL